MTFSHEVLCTLQGSKNLLAFSYGSDSTALFYVLLKQHIAFDMAMINYKMRKQSDEEEHSARILASEFHKKIYVKTAPQFKVDFQNKAREFRYEFFTEICQQFGYENVILAHHLNDRFEWFLRQIARGAGVLELLGMKGCEKRGNFTLVRPFLNTSKAEILEFLEKEKIKFFNDKSNENEKYERNFIRKHFATPFLREFSTGVARSFVYLEKDAKSLCDNEVAEFEGILVCAKNESIIAKAVKQKGIVLSAKQRKELLKVDSVISDKVGVVFMNDKALVFKYETCEKIPKKFKELYRRAKIPKLLRAYLYNHEINEQKLLSSFST